MKKSFVLKRSFFCGVVWCLGSLQYIANLNAFSILFSATFILGIVECVFSFHYQKRNSAVLKVLLALQALYYLAAFLYTIAVVSNMKIFGALMAACMFALTISTIFTVLKKNRDGDQ